MVNKTNHNNLWMAVVSFVKLAILFAMINFILFIANVVIKFDDAFATHKTIKKQASMTKYKLTGIFEIFSPTLTQIILKIQDGEDIIGNSKNNH